MIQILIQTPLYITHLISTFSQPPFQPLHSQIKIEPPSTPTSITNVTPTYSPLTSEHSDNNNSVNTQIFNELDNFITLQQKIYHPQLLTIRQLSQSITSSNTSTPTPSPNPISSSNPIPSTTNRAYRTFKRKLPYTPFPAYSQPAQSFVNHPLHTNTKKFLQLCLHFFPQYIYFYSDPNDENPNYVNELIPNTFMDLILSLYCHHDHHIIRPNEDIFLYDDKFANPQLTEKIFNNTPYVFTINSPPDGWNQI